MTLELTPTQVSYLKDLIFDKIDQIGDFDELSPEFQDILRQLRKNKE